MTDKSLLEIKDFYQKKKKKKDLWRQGLYIFPQLTTLWGHWVIIVPNSHCGKIVDEKKNKNQMGNSTQLPLWQHSGWVKK